MHRYLKAPPDIDRWVTSNDQLKQRQLEQTTALLHRARDLLVAEAVDSASRLKSGVFDQSSFVVYISCVTVIWLSYIVKSSRRWYSPHAPGSKQHTIYYLSKVVFLTLVVLVVSITYYTARREVDKYLFPSDLASWTEARDFLDTCKALEVSPPFHISSMNGALMIRCRRLVKIPGCLPAVRKSQRKDLDHLRSPSRGFRLV